MQGGVLEQRIWYSHLRPFCIIFQGFLILLEQEFEVADAFDVAKILQLQTAVAAKCGSKFNKIFIDLNGSRDIGIVHACLEKLQRAICPELIVVKSIKMKALVLQCTAFECESQSSQDAQDALDVDEQSTDA